MQQGTSLFPSLGLNFSIYKQGVALDQWLSGGVAIRVTWAAYPKATSLRCPKSRKCPGAQAWQKHLGDSGAHPSALLAHGSFHLPHPALNPPSRTKPRCCRNPATPPAPQSSTERVTASPWPSSKLVRDSRGKPHCLETSPALPVLPERPPSQERKFSNQGNGRGGEPFVTR